ncbi:MAG: hypothetical protein ACJ719_10255, partial [Nitrososphaeraceae archaeon]
FIKLSNLLLLLLLGAVTILFTVDVVVSIIQQIYSLNRLIYPLSLVSNYFYSEKLGAVLIQE